MHGQVLLGCCRGARGALGGLDACACVSQGTADEPRGSMKRRSMESIVFGVGHGQHVRGLGAPGTFWEGKMYRG